METSSSPAATNITPSGLPETAERRPIFTLAGLSGAPVSVAVFVGLAEINFFTGGQSEDLDSDLDVNDTISLFGLVMVLFLCLLLGGLAGFLSGAVGLLRRESLRWFCVAIMILNALVMVPGVWILVSYLGTSRLVVCE